MSIQTKPSRRVLLGIALGLALDCSSGAKPVRLAEQPDASADLQPGQVLGEDPQDAVAQDSVPAASVDAEIDSAPVGTVADAQWDGQDRLGTDALQWDATQPNVNPDTKSDVTRHDRQPDTWPDGGEVCDPNVEFCLHPVFCAINCVYYYDYKHESTCLCGGCGSFGGAWRITGC
jgi:hypothetical protein